MTRSTAPPITPPCTAASTGTRAFSSAVNDHCRTRADERVRACRRPGSPSVPLIAAEDRQVHAGAEVPCRCCSARRPRALASSLMPVTISGSSRQKAGVMVFSSSGRVRRTWATLSAISTSKQVRAAMPPTVPAAGRARTRRTATGYGPGDVAAPSSPRPRPSCRCRGWRSSATARRMLADVDWTVRDGERWVVLGPNGAGKTTLLQVAVGVAVPDPRHGRTCSASASARPTSASCAPASGCRARRSPTACPGARRRSTSSSRRRTASSAAGRERYDDGDVRAGVRPAAAGSACGPSPTGGSARCRRASASGCCWRGR